MESFGSGQNIAHLSFLSADKLLDNIESETCNNNSLRNIPINDGSCNSIPSRFIASNRTDENFNNLNDITRGLKNLEIDSQNNEEKRMTSLKTRDEISERDLPRSETLSISSNLAENSETHQLAGRIDSVIVSMGVALVIPVVVTNLLDIDTPVFLCTQKSPTKNAQSSDYALIGHIDDVFGPVGDPMYSVRLERAIYQLLRADAEIYYIKNHSSTTLIRVEEKSDKTFRVIRETNYSFMK